ETPESDVPAPPDTPHSTLGVLDADEGSEIAPAAPRAFRRIAVLGLGLIGGSVALRCAQVGYQVVGYDPAWQSDEARSHLAKYQISVAESPGAAAVGADLIVLAVPLGTMATTAHAIRDSVAPWATITDVGSVKGAVREAISAAGLEAFYVGGHPMAGNEHTGFEFATSELLVEAPWALTRNTMNDQAFAERRIQLVRDWVERTFSARVVELNDDEHDAAQALISGLPHIFATQLLNQVAGAPSSLSKTALRLAAGSFRDGTRVAHTDPERTAALVSENAEAVIPVLRQAIAELSQLADDLEVGNSFEPYFHRADALR
ncbi:MAG: prephenate dehydrogenase/arogenate dehydrogenase family protein, partial [Promicromonosporaceae bacterium]|nr:prephenate dehydrogenase/arogenate dehydrogenase family protein [Promicromonosporaceae bacterium]